MGGAVSNNRRISLAALASLPHPLAKHLDGQFCREHAQAVGERSVPGSKTRGLTGNGERREEE